MVKAAAFGNRDTGNPDRAGFKGPATITPRPRRVRDPHAPSRPPWRRPSPSPPRNIGKPHRTGLKGPASARPAPGGRFPPAGAGAGLWYCVPHRFWLNPSTRAGRVSASPVPARTPPDDNYRRVRDLHAPSPASMAKAIAFATARHQHPLPVGGQKPPASARPAIGGRFSPAGSGAGLWRLVPPRLRLTPSTQAGARQCLACSRPDTLMRYA